MRIPIPKERAELLKIFSPFLCTNKETGEPTLIDTASDEAKSAFEKYKNMIDISKE